MMSDKMGEKYSRKDIKKVFKLAPSRISLRQARPKQDLLPQAQESNDDEEMQDTTRSRSTSTSPTHQSDAQ